MAEIRKLKDWPIEVLDGDRSKRYPKRNEMVNDGVLFLSTPSIVDGRINVENSKFITEEKFSEIKKGRLVENDIVMTTRGTIGKLAFFKSTKKHKTGLINAQMLILRTAPDVVNPRFLFYLMGSDSYQNEIKNFSSGSAQPQIPITDLKETELKIPELSVQNKIVYVIDAYSDLIENNNRRIAILEDMAQSLYREWFVHFRFPGHEDCQFKDSELGRIPEGWEVKSFGELVHFLRDSVRKGSVDENTPYMGLEHFPRKSISLSDWELVNEIGSSKLKFEKGDILFGKIRPYFHKVGVAQTDGLCSSDTFVWRPVDRTNLGFVANIAFSDDFVAHSVQSSQGTKMPRANWDVLKDYAVTVPNRELLCQYNDLVNLMILEIEVLSLKNRNLKEQRELLLPKLVSGKIEVIYA